MGGKVTQNRAGTVVHRQTFIEILTIFDNEGISRELRDLAVTGGEDRVPGICFVVCPQGNRVTVTGEKGENQTGTVRPQCGRLSRDKFITIKIAGDGFPVDQIRRGVRPHAAVGLVVGKDEGRCRFFGISSRGFRDILVRQVTSDLGACTRQMKAREFSAELRSIHQIRHQRTGLSGSYTLLVLTRVIGVIVRVFKIIQDGVIRLLSGNRSAERDKTKQSCQQQCENNTEFLTMGNAKGTYLHISLLRH